ncbi:MAG: DUF4358 domain-containing protein [Clostridia bacterium]
MKTETDFSAQPAAEQRPALSRHAGLSKTDFFFGIIKLLLLAFLIFYIGMLFSSNTTKDVSIHTIEKVMAPFAEEAELTPGDANTMKREFSLDAGAYPNAIIYSSDSLMDVSEFFIVKVEDTEEFSALETAVGLYLEEQMKKFDGYGTNQYDLLKHAVITEKGPYFFFGVSEQVEKWEEAFLSCIK